MVALRMEPKALQATELQPSPFHLNLTASPWLLKLAGNRGPSSPSAWDLRRAPPRPAGHSESSTASAFFLSWCTLMVQNVGFAVPHGHARLQDLPVSPTSLRSPSSILLVPFYVRDVLAFPFSPLASTHERKRTTLLFLSTAPALPED